MQWPLSTPLPIQQVLPEVREKLHQYPNLIVSAAPGAGKSTLLPLSLIDEAWLKGKKILLLEPRRIAAISLAERMASLLGEGVGMRVGYRIRFDSKISKHTRIEVVTEGILTRMLHQDNALEDYGLVIFDEFHERNIHADIALAFCLESQQVLRPDLKLLVMSATLDLSVLAAHLKAPIVACPGKQFPVTTHYVGHQQPEALASSCTRTILQALKEQEGDILVFLPGLAEIKQCQQVLQNKTLDIALHLLHGQLPIADQQAAIFPDPTGKRKVVLATSIAETSLTIEGIQVVIDSGYTRKAVFDPKTALSGLQTTRVTLDAAEQRRGRAGRLGPGTCYRLWSKATEMHMSPFRNPEIVDADLMPLALDLLQWGVSDADQLIWLDPPPTDKLTQAQETLYQMGAVSNRKLTAHGKMMHRLPCHPRLAHMLLSASDSQKHLAADLAALLEEKDPLSAEADADLTTRLEALRAHRQKVRTDRRFEKVQKTSAFYRQLFQLQEKNTGVDPYETGKLLAYAYPERIAASIGNSGTQFLMANGRKANLSVSDSLAHQPFLTIAQVDARMGKIFLAAPIHQEHLLAEATRYDRVAWDLRKGGLIAQQDWKIGSLVIQSVPLIEIPEEQAQEALLELLSREGERLLNFDASVKQWQHRVMSLSQWNPEQGWPQVDTGHLLQEVRKWLSPYIQGVRKVEDLKKINLLEALSYHLTYDQQQQLNQLAPAGLQVPSGSQIPLQYYANGEAPFLAVRLQEVFGWLDSPRINDGKMAVTLHLLSPGFKPVQVTADLKSFWDGAYFEVRKELKRRYPKHSWPDRPLAAQAVRGVPKRT